MPSEAMMTSASASDWLPKCSVTPPTCGLYEVQARSNIATPSCIRETISSRKSALEAISHAFLTRIIGHGLCVPVDVALRGIGAFDLEIYQYSIIPFY